MKEHHPSRELLELFALGDLPASEAAQVERHLEACSDCRDYADEAAALLSVPLLDWLGSQYDNAFDRAVRGAAEQLAGLKSESRNAEVLLAELLREPIPERRRKIREEERFHSLKLCQLLRTRSHDHWFSDPFTALELAELAAGLAQYLDSRRYGVGLVEDLRALSWASLSNAFKLTSDLWQAERTLRQAWCHYEQSYGDIQTKVELLNFTTAVKIAQGRFPEAVRLTDQAVKIYREGQQPHLEGLMLIMRAQALGNNGRYQEAITAAGTAIDRVGAQSPHLLLICRHNMIFFLLRCGALTEARQLLKRLGLSIQKLETGCSLHIYAGSRGSLQRRSIGQRRRKRLSKKPVSSSSNARTGLRSSGSPWIWRGSTPNPGAFNRPDGFWTMSFL